jgi:hypothetical protein
MTKMMMALSACVLLAGAQAWAEPKVKHPNLHAAIFELREARTELKEAKKDFGGKKEKAIKAINAAIDSLKKCLDIKGDDYKGLDRDKDRKKFKDHPKLRSALEDLRDAKRDLKEAGTNFGGHKKQAIADIDAAINIIQDILK